MRLSNPPVCIFVSYASVDRAVCEEIVNVLRPLEARRVATIWYDRSLTPGDRYYDEIMKHLKGAHLVLMLLSTAYLASRACAIEAKQAMAQASDGKGKVLPVIVGECHWKDTPYAAYQVLPLGGSTLAGACDRTAALDTIVQGIESTIAEFLRPAPSPSLAIFTDADLREMVGQIDNAIGVIRKAHAFQPSLPVQVLLELNQLTERKSSFEEELAVRLGKF